MFLKELEIYGFKSFPKRTKFSFNSGITAIVGPNGCGKSNIADAVRWVLGEQNIRSLRGKKLTDIIYSGNHQGKALNLAEVSLTLDNTEKTLPLEWEEISIKRRIYRSGETENFINGLPCKLKEIQNLLLNTGLGKNTYSMIAQGEIDIVLSAKPSDRRYLFEEAALISRYKYEKQNTLKRIEETSENLGQIDNILSEIKNQLIILEEEAEQLLTYKNYKKKIRNFELFLLWQRYNVCRTNYLKINKNMAAYQYNKKEKLKAIEDNEKEIKKIIKEIEGLKKQLENHQIENTEFLKIRNNMQNHINIELEKRNELNRKIDENNRDIKNTRNKIESIFRNMNHNDNKILEIEEKLDKLIYDHNDQKMKYADNKKYIEEIGCLKDLNQKMFSNLKYNDSLIREKKIKTETTLSFLRNNLKQILKRKSHLENNLYNVKSRIDKFIERSKNDDGTNLKKYLEKNEENIKEARDKMSRVNFSIEKTQQMVLLKEERIRIIEKSIHHSSEGNERQSKLFCDHYQRNNTHSICKKLVDIIENIPAELEKVIEIALRDSLNAIIVSRLEEAFHLFYKLSKKDLKNLKIIPMDNLPEMTERGHAILGVNEQNMLGYADEIVNCPEEYTQLFRILLGNTIIVKDNATLIKIFCGNKGKFRVISLEGMIMRQNGSIHFFLEDENKKNNLFHLKNEKSQMNAEVKDLKKSMRINREFQEKYKNIFSHLKRENNELKQKLLEYENKNVKKEENIEELHFQVKDLDRSIKSLNHEEKDLLEEINLTSKANNFYHYIYRQMNQYKNNIEESYKNINHLMFKKNERSHHLENRINAIKNEIAIKKERVNNLKYREGDIQLQLKDLELLLKSKQEDCQKNIKRKDDLSKRIEADQEKLAKLKQMDESAQKKLEEIRKSIKLKYELSNHLSKSKINMQASFEKIREKQHREELLKVQYEEKYENIKNETIKDYQISVNELENYRDQCSSRKEASLQITDLREKIMNMGQINFDAGNRYQNQLERYNNLKSKYDEILEAKKNLLELVLEIDRIATERFKNTFNQVKIYFNELFKSIFSGGEGILELTLNDDISQSEIDIIARPPGKKTRNIELLSSGEKALTAIALLLALWKVNPSPFCFFDEIDTALDETNADRLSMILKGDDLKNSQLLVITHQKSTMEAADTLCGITMQESGISKLVSVKLTK